MTKISGDNQKATVGDILPAPIVIEVKDQGGALVPGARLAWQVVQGGGKLETSAAETDATGKGQATWRLGSVVGGQTVQVSAGALSPVTFSASATRLPVASVQLSPAVDTARFVGDTVRLTATAHDETGALIPDVTFSFTSTDTAVATVVSSGLVTGKATGTAKVVATAESKADTATIIVLGEPPPTPVVITSIEPSVLIEGKAATIRGTGFAATASGNVVSIDGLAATVTTASTTQLTLTVPIADCRPPRQGQVRVQVGAQVGTATSGIRPETLLRMDVGSGYYGSTCLHLDSGTNDRYLVGVISVSESPASLVAARLTGSAGISLLASEEAGGGPSRSGEVTPFEALSPPPRGPAKTEPAGSRVGMGGFQVLNPGEDEVRRRERAILESLDMTTVRAAAQTLLRDPRPTLAAPSNGDTLSLKVPQTCSIGTPVRAVVRHVGDGLIFAEDVENPVTNAFTAQELQDLDAFYAENTHPVITSYYGQFFDIDSNQRVLVLITKEVNKMEGINGFVWAVDLVPPATCPGGNLAEIFYGLAPDPSGVHGRTVTTSEIKSIYPALIAHEVTHILQQSQAIFSSGVFRSTWESEGGATLAEQLVGFRTLGHGPGQDLGYSAWQSGVAGGWYGDLVNDLALYFGYRDGSHVAGAPEQCSWMGRESEGNGGPCYLDRAPYGTPSLFLRMILDRYGAGYSGGESAMMRALTGSSKEGLGNLASVTGQDQNLLMVLFATALWADGRMGNWITSWNLADIFDNLVESARLQPYATTAAEPSLSVSVRGGSSAYLLWSPPSARGPTSLKIRTPSGGNLPSHMLLWVLRVQ